ncbi:MAG: RagB/SusD family nutrient uptake outer membrane protein [Cyclobacteriaceae bacterium]
MSAYAMLGQDHYTVPGQLWPYGDLRAGDAYKGGDGPSDISIYHAMEVFNTIQPDMSAYAPSVLGDINNKKWLRQYTAISRVNFALRVLNEMDPSIYPLRNQRIAEMHFLRGHYYFDLKILYKFIPWIDENASVEEIIATTNREFTDQQLWDKIIAEFRLAVDGLSDTQKDLGRPSKYTAQAYLVKALLYAAYEQNDDHQVISINTANLEEVVGLVSDIENSGSFALEQDFANPFLYEYENGSESVWAIQRSHDDGTTTGNIDFGSALNNPMSTEFGCCGFHIPSQNLANAFKTGANGLPQFDSFNQSDIDILTETVDPRLDHTIAQPDKPWKYETSIIYNVADWSRQPGIYGPFSSLKENESPNCECFEQIPPFMSTSKNTILIRYADVLLWKAEALIELGRHTEALPIINSIRQRARNSTTLLQYANGDPLSNYLINDYDGSNWTQEYARQALRWERRLELALEGHRFFDLVRWGIAAESLNQYLIVEKTKREYLESALFEAGKHEYLPIPQQQIDLSNNEYTQNRGYN